MYTFTFERPSTTVDAAKLAANGGAKLLAGGQTLLASMKLRLANPEQLIDLGGVAELAGIKRDGNALVIGAMTRHADVADPADLIDRGAARRAAAERAIDRLRGKFGQEAVVKGLTLDDGD
jgi:carbon-monoxide dehydrogenase medium subunit